MIIARKLIFGSFIVTLLFVLLSVIVSLSFVQVSIDVDLSIPAPAAMPQGSFLDRVRHHASRLQLGKLRRSRSCHFYCQPAVQLHQERKGGDRPPAVTIMITHCLRCLRRKGFMETVMYRRRIKRRSMLATPVKEVTSPMPRTTTFEKRSAPYRMFFGGWLSISGNSSSIESPKSSQLVGFRRLLSFTSDDFLSKEVTESPIIIDDRIEDDYINNYSDAKEEEQIPDFAKIEKTTQDIISRVLIGGFIFAAVLFMVVAPCLSFLNMCTENYQTNRAMCCDILCCRNPKYSLVKDMCEKYEIFIPNYAEYTKLMKQHKEKESSSEEGESTVQSTISRSESSLINLDKNSTAVF